MSSIDDIIDRLIENDSEAGLSRGSDGVLTGKKGHFYVVDTDSGEFVSGPHAKYSHARNGKGSGTTVVDHKGREKGHSQFGED